jgi:hypothetical protein
MRFSSKLLWMCDDLTDKALGAQDFTDAQDGAQYLVYPLTFQQHKYGGLS